MRYYSILLLFFTASFAAAQTGNLNPKSLKRLLTAKTDVNNDGSPVEWHACNKDSCYYKSDTVRLYSNSYYELTAGCCNYVSWVFRDNGMLDLISLMNCQEPPVSSFSPNNSGLKVKYETCELTGKKQLLITLYKGSRIKAQFIVVACNTVKLKNETPSYELVLVKRNYTDVF